MAELKFLIEGLGAIYAAEAFLSLPEITGTWELAKKQLQTTKVTLPFDKEITACEKNEDLELVIVKLEKMPENLIVELQNDLYLDDSQIKDLKGTNKITTSKLDSGLFSLCLAFRELKRGNPEKSSKYFLDFLKHYPNKKNELESELWARREYLARVLTEYLSELKANSEAMNEVFNELLNTDQVSNLTSLKINHLDDSISASLQLLTFSERLFDSFSSLIINLSEKLFNRGVIHQQINIDTESEKSVYQIRDKMVEMRSSIAETKLFLGVIYIAQGKLYDGLRRLEQSLDIYRQIEDLVNRSRVIYHIGRTHHLLGNLDKARSYYRDALRLYEHLKDQEGVAACRTGLGNLFIRMGYLDEALRELKQAKQIYQELNQQEYLQEVEQVIQVAEHNQNSYQAV